MDTLNISPAVLRKYMTKTGQTAKELAACLNVAEASVFRWLNGSKPKGTTAAILGLMIYSSGVCCDREVQCWAEKGVKLFLQLCSAMDLDNEDVKELHSKMAMDILRGTQQKEFRILEKEIRQAERDAISEIRELHRCQRQTLKDSLAKEQGKLADKLMHLINRGTFDFH
jgi:hypothetical protein